MKLYSIVGTFSLLLISVNGFAASFDCGKASTPVEKRICNDAELSKLDESLSEAYQKALGRKDIREEMIESQKQWLRDVRNACPDAECLRSAYHLRIKELGLTASYGIAIFSPSKTKTSAPGPAPEGSRTQPRTEQLLEPSMNAQLRHAAECGSLEAVKTLVAKGGDVNAKTNGGITPLLAAIWKGHLDIVKFLIEKGADLNMLSGEDQTALMYAARGGKLDVARTLIDNGVDLHGKSKEGKTALMLAAGRGSRLTTKFLMDSGADVNAKDKEGETALMVAVRMGHIDVVELLISSGAAVNAMNKKGQTALDVASEERRSEGIARYLKEHGAKFGISSESVMTADKKTEAAAKESGISSAAEYVLVMSKDDCVCQHMLKIYNEDLRKYGEIKYDHHEEFKAIKWKKQKIYYQPGESAPLYEQDALISKFDINNDGSPEIIIKDEHRRVRSVDSDAIYIFREKDIADFKDEILIDDASVKKAIGVWGVGLDKNPFEGNVYALHELPAYEVYTTPARPGKQFKGYYSLGGWFYFYPLLYQGKFFTSMHDWEPDFEEEWDTGSEKSVDIKWEVILRLSPENQLQDVCYLLKVSNCKNRKGD